MEPDLFPEPYFEHVARRFRVLGEPVRLRLLKILMAAGERTVQQLVEATGQHQANVSKHLRILLDEHIVSRRQEGLYAYYAISDPTVASLCLIVCSQLKVFEEDGASGSNGS